MSLPPGAFPAKERMASASLWAQANGAKAILLTSALLSALLVRAVPAYSIQSSYFRTFLAIVAVRVIILGTWVMIIWPKLLSPLRHLPQPAVCDFARKAPAEKVKLMIDKRAGRQFLLGPFCHDDTGNDGYSAARVGQQHTE